MTTILPPSTDFTGASVTQGGAKAFMTSLRSFISDLLGTDSADTGKVRNLLGFEAPETPVTTLTGANTDIGAAKSVNVLLVTGVSSITGFVAAADGVSKKVRVDTGGITLANSVNLALPGGANIVTAAGDQFEAYSNGTGWVVRSYSKKDGKALVAVSNAGDTLLGSVVVPGSAMSFGGMSLLGTKATYGGMNFKNPTGVTNYGTLACNATQHGWYNAADNAFVWSCTDAGAFSLNGSLTATGNVSGYSDERVKANWRNFGEGFVFDLAGVKSGIYDRTDMELTQVGVSAQSLLAVMPNAVIEDEDGKLSVAYGNAALASSIELAKFVIALEARISELEGK